jgi:hypothetical protein
VIGANSAGLAGEINLFKSFVPERADHSCSVDYLVYCVKRRLRWGQRPSAWGIEGRGFPSLNGETCGTRPTRARWCYSIMSRTLIFPSFEVLKPSKSFFKPSEFDNK